MERPRGLGVRAAALICTLVGGLMFLNTLDCEFCFDDDAAIERNPDLRANVSWTNLLWDDFWGTPMKDKDSHKSYRPLCVATFRLNYLVHELQPMGYHLVNVLLHSAVCYLYVQLCGLVFREVWPALIAGLLFAVHPIHTEAVAGLVGRADVLATVFFLVAVFSYRKAVISSNGGWEWLSVTVLLGLCSALSKEIGITVVAVCLVYEFFIMHKMNLESSVALLGTLQSQPKKLPAWFKPFVLRAILLLSFTIAFLVLRVKLNQGPPIFAMTNNPAMGFETPYRQLHWAYLCFLNLWLLLNPWNLCAEYSMGTIPPVLSVADPRNLLTIVTFAAVICLGLYSICGTGKLRRNTRFGLALMVLPFIPASNLFFPVGFVIAERVLYMPSMGFCVLIGYGVWHVVSKSDRKIVRGLVGIGLVYLLAVYSTKTLTRNRDWHSSLSLYNSAVQISPRNGKMFNNLATVHDKNGNRSFAEELFKYSIAVEPEYITGYMNLGYVLKEEKRFEEAIEIYRRSAKLVTRGLAGDNIHITPKNVKVYNVLADMLREHTQSFTEAYQYSQRAIQSEPEWDAAHNSKGLTLLKMGRPIEAKAAFEEALRLNPELAVANSNLGEAYKDLQDFTLAEKFYRKALSMDSNHTLTKFRLAGLVIKTKTITVQRLLESEKLLQEVLEVEPDNGNATFSLGLIYYDLKNFTRAEEQFMKTLEITPNDPGALYNLGVMLTNSGRYEESLEHLSKLREAHPNHMTGTAQLGTCYMQMNEKAKARAVFQEVLEKDPTNQIALNNLGLLMIQMQEIDEAIRLFSELFRLDPSNEPAKRQIAELHKFKQRMSKNPNATGTDTTH